MEKIKNLILLFEKLFPEEYFLKGLTNLSLDIFKNEKIDSFFDRFYRHLKFYEKNLYPLPFEKIYKAGNIIFYHLQKNQVLNDYFLRKINNLINFSKNVTFGLTEDISKKFLKLIFKSYVKFDKKRKKILFQKLKKILDKEAKKVFQNPVKDFQEWQKGLYGLDILDKKILLKEAIEIKNKIKKEFKEENISFDPETFINFFIKYFLDLLRENIDNLEVIKIPFYLKPVIPVAGAYTFDLLTNNPRYVVFINFKKTISPAKIIFVLFHEIFGHSLHFKLIKEYCSSNLRKLPYLSRFPLTEGFALLAEDYLLKVMSKEKVQKDFEKNLRRGFSGKKLFLSIQGLYYKYRLLRYLRYLFEYEVYFENNSPGAVIKNLSKNFNLDEKFLKEDLLSFLITPGYASCYIGGYKILKKLGNYKDSSFRKDLAKKGFDFFSLS